MRPNSPGVMTIHAMTTGETRATGTIASLPAVSGTATVVFDLGPYWDDFPVLSVTFWAGSASATANSALLQLYGSDVSGSYNQGRRLGLAFATAASATYLPTTPSAGPQTYNVTPMGRYIHAKVDNTDPTLAFGASPTLSVVARQA